MTRPARPDRRRLGQHLGRLALGTGLSPWRLLGTASATRAAATATALAPLALSGCATLGDDGSAQARALLASPPADLPRAVHLAGTPFFPQTELQCGPATLAMLLHAIGHPVSPAELTPQLFVPERGGSLQIEMLAAPRRHDALATRLPQRLDAVLRELAAGHPVGVMQNLALDWVPMWHFAVLIGFDLDRREAILRSGTTREQRLDLLTFERTWARAQRWAFTVLPPEQLPATAELPAVREACLGFERVAPPARAVTAWQTAARRWQGDLVIGMGLGNSLLQAERPDDAAQAFTQVAEQTDAAAAWNNLANVRLRQGRLPEARDAARRAVLRAATAEPALQGATRATLAEVEAAFAAVAPTSVPRP